MKTLTICLILLTSSFNIFAQLKDIKSASAPVKPPKYTYSISVGYNYALTGNKDVLTFSQVYDPVANANIFNSESYAINMGLGIMTQFKAALDKKRKIWLTGDLSYNHFLNSKSNGNNRTRWQLLSFGGGADYCFNPNSKNKVFLGGSLLYSIIWGAWQTNIVYPDGYQSNVYVNFNAAQRLGLALKLNTEYKLSKKTTFLVGLKGVWANIAPKQNNFSDSPYDTYINDSQDNNGIVQGGTKQVIFLQLMAGINFW